MDNKTWENARLGYRGSKDSYIIYYKLDGKNKTMSFSAKKYGTYAKEIAEMSMEREYRLEHYIEKVDEKTYKLIIESNSSKAPGMHEVLVDADMVEEIAQLRWYLNTDRNTNYAQNSKKGLMHRYILTELTSREIKKGEVIDHLDRNGLNNTLENFRVCTHAQNIENARIRVDHADDKDLGEIKGVYRQNSSGKNQYVANWYEVDESGKRKRKSKCFAIKKYGAEKARKLAIQARKEAEERLGIIS